MYGDSDVIRHRASQLRDQGVEIRASADRLVASTESIGWTGRAADSLRERVRERATHLRVAAGRHDAAAGALEKHLAEVEALKDAIAHTERRAAALHADRPDDDIAAPPSGHRDWLDVELPGA